MGDVDESASKKENEPEVSGRDVYRVVYIVWHWYSGRGIAVCEQEDTSLGTFATTMSPRGGDWW